MRRRRFSLKFRLTASLFVVSAVGIASAVYFAYREVYNTDEAIAERTLQGQANEFLESMSVDRATGATRIQLPRTGSLGRDARFQRSSGNTR